MIPLWFVDQLQCLSTARPLTLTLSPEDGGEWTGSVPPLATALRRGGPSLESVVGCANILTSPSFSEPLLCGPRWHPFVNHITGLIMNEYWEVTHGRAVPTQAVWGMQPTFEINGLTHTQHGTLTDSLPVLAQTRDDKENDLTDALSAKRAAFAKVSNIAGRVPGLIDGLLDDEDLLKDQLDAIYAVDADGSENSALRRARLLMPLWTDVNVARAATTPAKPALTIDYQGTALGVADLSTGMDAALLSQKTAAEKQRDVTNAKSVLRAADRKLDRANKRWYKAWLLAFPEETPEGAAAQSQIPTGGGTAQAQALLIASATPLADQRVQLNFAPASGAHATTKELQYQLPGEEEFGHSTPITANQMTVGPFDPGSTVSFRTRVANSNPGFVTSPVVTVIVAG